MSKRIIDGNKVFKNVKLSYVAQGTGNSNDKTHLPKSDDEISIIVHPKVKNTKPDEMLYYTGNNGKKIKRRYGLNNIYKD